MARSRACPPLSALLAALALVAVLLPTSTAQQRGGRGGDAAASNATNPTPFVGGLMMPEAGSSDRAVLGFQFVTKKRLKFSEVSPVTGELVSGNIHLDAESFGPAIDPSPGPNSRPCFRAKGSFSRTIFNAPASGDGVRPAGFKYIVSAKKIAVVRPNFNGDFAGISGGVVVYTERCRLRVFETKRSKRPIYDVTERFCAFFVRANSFVVDGRKDENIFWSPNFAFFGGGGAGLDEIPAVFDTTDLIPVGVPTDTPLEACEDLGPDFFFTRGTAIITKGKALVKPNGCTDCN